MKSTQSSNARTTSCPKSTRRWKKNSVHRGVRQLRPGTRRQEGFQPLSIAALLQDTEIVAVRDEVSKTWVWNGAWVVGSPGFIQTPKYIYHEMPRSGISMTRHSSPTRCGGGLTARTVAVLEFRRLEPPNFDLDFFDDPDLDLDLPQDSTFIFVLIGDLALSFMEVDASADDLLSRRRLVVRCATFSTPSSVA
ncbi:unnamed protein product [Phytophthora fragariaefolia]|uniref:Unnamed protein product n=1 Tax=Phytophthora fragariaefolia TaxID=1490495 RepID=A0A9W6YML3_9STRA|nr:unnamed protein product [Phytophthora fragariaefolia]